MFGVIALYIGLDPLDGDLNNLIPQMAGTYLGPVLLCLAFIMIIGSLSSTADSDLSALSSIVMADIYGQSKGRGNANPKTMLLIGRVTMIVARSEEHTSELQSRGHLVCRLLLEKKNTQANIYGAS